MVLLHKTCPIQVWVDVDLEISDMVIYLNTIPGVRTYACCQGTLGEGGQNPYRPYVMALCDIPESFERLKSEFDIVVTNDSDGSWFYVHPKELIKVSTKLAKENK